MNIIKDYKRAEFIYRLRRLGAYVDFLLSNLHQDKLGVSNFREATSSDIEKFNKLFDFQIDPMYFESFIIDELPFNQYNKELFKSRVKAYRDRWITIFDKYDIKTSFFFIFAVIIVNIIKFNP